jgi:anti-sigma B factor antagonist
MLETSEAVFERTNTVQITESREGPILVVTLAGSLDGFAAPGVEKHLVRLIDSGDRRLVIDMCETDYISSVGLGLLVVIHKQVLGDKGRVAFCSLRPAIAELFANTKLTELLDVKPNRAAAVASVQAP